MVIVPLLGVLVVALLFAVRSARRLDAGSLRSFDRVRRVGDVPRAPLQTHEIRPALALTPAAARGLLAHGALFVGLVLTGSLLVITDGEAHSGRNWSIGATLVLAIAGWAAIIAGHLLAMRPRRWGTEELLDSLPVGASGRTLAVLWAAVVPAVVGAALLGLAFAVHVARFDRPAGPLHVAELAVGPLLVLGGVVVGVAVARFFARPVWAVAAVVVVVLIEANLGDKAHRFRFLAFWVDEDPGLAAVTPRPAVAHVGWLVSWIAVMAVIAVWRRNTVRAVPAVFVAAMVGVVVTGWIQTRIETDDDVAHGVAMLTDPSTQDCRSIDDITYCAYPGEEYSIPVWSRVVAEVHRNLPDRATPPVVVRQRVPTVVGNTACSAERYLDVLRPKLAAALRPSDLWTADGGVHPAVGADTPPCSDEDLDGAWTAIQVGAHAVGLPPAPSWPEVRCAADGQARSVIALWAGSRGTDRGDRALELLERAARDGGGRLVFGTDDVDVGRSGWDTHPQFGVAWHEPDIAVARALRSNPDVGGLVAQHWDWVIDPSTTRSDLLRRLGVPDGPPVAESPEPESCRRRRL